MSNIDNTETINAEAPAAAIAPRCVDVRGLAAMLGVSPHTVMRMDEGGKLPPPLRFGATGKRGRKVWLIADIDYWLTHGQPSREKFMAMKRLK